MRAGALAVVSLLTAALGLAAGARAAVPLLAAAGDIACQSASPQFNGGLGTATRCRQLHTSDLLADRGLAAVLPLGDTQYCCASRHSYLPSYDISWGRVKGISHPVPGSAEYETRGAAGYFDYFNGTGARTGRAGRRGRGYYSFDLGAWHLIALNSNCRFVSCATGSAQERWLRLDLARHSNACTLAYLHGPRFSSVRGGDQRAVTPLWKALYAAGTDVVLSADSHNYERFAPQTPQGHADPAFGMRLFVVGTGGHSLRGFGAVRPNSELREARSFGVLVLALRPSGFDWRFVPDGGSTFSDSGGAACHSRPPRVRPQRPPHHRPHCTLTGTPGRDVLRGGPGRDVICGLGGADTIDARGGDDVVLGGDGADHISGGRGRDRLYGGRGRDVLRGGSGNDRLLGGSGRNRLFGGAGRDNLVSAFSRRDGDRMHGGRGADRGTADGRDRVRSVEHLRRRRQS